MDRPIIFSGQMAKRLLAREKFQTRRVLKLPGVGSLCIERGRPYTQHKDGVYRPVEPPYAIGDRLWAREGWKVLGREHDGETELAMEYLADGAKHKFASAEEWGSALAAWRKGGARRRPSIHMPRWASRITLIVTDVRVQRVRDLTDADAIAEGIYQRHSVGDDPMHDVWTWTDDGWRYGSPIEAFSKLWDSVHEEGAWRQNDWIVAISFRMILANIDSPEAKAELIPDADSRMRRRG